jgi:hypothetical protein
MIRAEVAGLLKYEKKKDIYLIQENDKQSDN